MIIQSHPSPNCGERKLGATADMIVLHYTAMNTAFDAIERLCDPTFEVSAHYVIAEDGQITQLVPDHLRAWHAGAGAWGDVVDVNSRSIGIEIANKGPDSDTPDFPGAQIQSVEGLLHQLLQDHTIPASRVIGHSDMAPGRKFDPGAYFPWQRLAKKGLAVWPSDIKCDGANWDQFKKAAYVFGYRASDAGWDDVLDAFRMRFLPAQTGVLSDQDVGVISALARDYPCALITNQNT